MTGSPPIWPAIAQPVPLGEGEVHVWAVALDDERAADDSANELLSPDEHERAALFRVGDARRRFVASRAALRSILGRYLHISPSHVAFDYDRRGKPRLSASQASPVSGSQLSTFDSRLTFNLAHSGELALVAVTRGCEVGVDVERFRTVERWRQIARRYFHTNEVEHIERVNAADQPAAFFRCWTAKEAVLKALGTGIGFPLDAFAVPVDATSPAWVGVRGERYWLAPLSPAPDYVGAVACLRSERTLATLRY